MHVLGPVKVEPIEVMLVAMQLIVTLVTVLLFEHSVVVLVVVRPVTSQPEMVVALLLHVMLESVPDPVRTVQSPVTWLAVRVSQPDLNVVVVEGWIEHPFRGESVAVEVQLVDVLPLLAVEVTQYAV